MTLKEGEKFLYVKPVTLDIIFKSLSLCFIIAASKWQIFQHESCFFFLYFLFGIVINYYQEGNH